MNFKIFKTIIFLICCLILGFGVGFYFTRQKLPKEIKNKEIFLYAKTDWPTIENNAKRVLPCASDYSGKIKGVIINHHLLASHFITRALCRVATSEPITIFLVGPNHFFRGPGKIAVANYNWQTPNGILPADQSAINKILASQAVSLDNGPFPEEHSMGNLVGFIKYYFPQAKIVPIIIKDVLKEAEINELTDILNQNSEKNSLIIASLDFSHYLPSAQAEKADEKTLPIIRELDYEAVKNLNENNQPDHVDSKPTLQVFLKLMVLKKAVNFSMIDHNNSGRLLNNFTDPTTSYITGFFQID